MPSTGERLSGTRRSSALASAIVEAARRSAAPRSTPTTDAPRTVLTSNRGLRALGRDPARRGHGGSSPRPAAPPVPYRQHPEQQLPDAEAHGAVEGHPPDGVQSGGCRESPGGGRVVSRHRSGPTSRRPGSTQRFEQPQLTQKQPISPPEHAPRHAAQRSTRVGLQRRLMTSSGLQRIRRRAYRTPSPQGGLSRS